MTQASVKCTEKDENKMVNRDLGSGEKSVLDPGVGKVH